MMGHDMGGHCGCMGHCGCGGGTVLSIEEEIQALEVQRLHLKFQLEMVDKRINGLKKIGK